MATEKRTRYCLPVTQHPATEELASISTLIEQLRNRLDLFTDAHPPRCRCALCGVADPDMKRNLGGLAAALHAFGGLIDMDRPQSFTEAESRLEEIRKRVDAAGGFETAVAAGII